MPDGLLRGGVLIIGPGIAGATSALALADAGEPVTTGRALDVTTVSSQGHLSRKLPRLTSCKSYNTQAICTVHGSG
jgi:heterodisulfide reductase subunit A-like polyferredoxin